jgi:electron transfer flavoprotein beta subunit
VPETGEARFDEETMTMIREGIPSIVNPFDLYAAEEALRIKETLGGEVLIMTMGPPKAAEALQEIISMGADDAILLTDRAFAGADTWATSLTLAEGIRGLGTVDLVICGKQAVDGDTAQVGPELADRLGWPFIAYVRKIEEIREGYIRAERMMEFGYEVVESSLPAVISVVKEINEPRLPSLKGKLRAKKHEIREWGAEELGLEGENTGLAGSPTQVIKVFTPAPRQSGTILTGEPDEMAGELVERLKGLKLI